jgi:hypothetical protein
LLLRLASAARAFSQLADPELVSFASALVCTNDLLVLVAERLLTDLSTHDTAPVDAHFVTELIGSANARGCGGNLRYLFERTLAEVAVRSS